MRPQRLTIFIFIVLVAIVIYWPNVVWMLRPQFAVSPKSEEGRALSIENTYLKSRLALQSAISAETLSRGDYEPVFVYARYPFNFKEELVVSSGEGGRIKINGAVLLRGEELLDSEEMIGIFIGTVSSTRSHSSVVETIFDYRWQSAVHIGEDAVPGLLEGGLDPRIVLVPKDEDIQIGDVVMNADDRFEYGLPIGVVKSVQPSDDNLFQEIGIDLPYDLSGVSVVWVERNVIGEE